MAKVKLPLISLEARGAIGKALVYFPWKGINAVREYVIPANPQTPAQIAQRGYLKSAVSDWHTSEFTPSDAGCWRLASTIVPRILTGFNTFIRTHVLNSIAGKTWIKHDHFKATYDTGFYFDLEVRSDDPSTMLYWEMFSPIYYKITEYASSYLPGPDRWVGKVPLPATGIDYFLKTKQDGAASHGEIRFLKVRIP